MKHRYYTYFFWTLIIVIISFIFFIARFKINLFSANHLSLLFNNFTKLPSSIIISFAFLFSFWIFGGAILRFVFKPKKEKEIYKTPHEIHEKISNRPLKMETTSYIPEEGHYQTKEAVFEPPKKEIPEEKEIIFEAPKKIEEPVIAKEKIVEIKVQNTKINIKNEVEKLFTKKEIMQFQEPQIGSVKVDFFGASDDALFFLKFVNDSTEKMMIGETKKRR